MTKRIIASMIMAISALFIVGGVGVFAYLYNQGLSGLYINTQPKDGQIKVACVGDSITYGHSVSNWKENNYPKVLQELLGEFISASAARAYVLEGRYSFGAAHILYANELSRIAEEIDDNLYMFPMSIHEWFIVPVSEIESAQDMSEMASDYFETGLVEAEEVLSKAAYCYDREKGLYMIGE